jgi:hypothetical protein
LRIRAASRATAFQRELLWARAFGHVEERGDSRDHPRHHRSPLAARIAPSLRSATACASKVASAEVFSSLRERCHRRKAIRTVAAPARKCIHLDNPRFAGMEFCRFQSTGYRGPARIRGGENKRVPTCSPHRYRKPRGPLMVFLYRNLHRPQARQLQGSLPIYGLVLAFTSPRFVHCNNPCLDQSVQNDFRYREGRQRLQHLSRNHAGAAKRQQPWRQNRTLRIAGQVSVSGNRPAGYWGPCGSG